MRILPTLHFVLLFHVLLGVRDGYCGKAINYKSISILGDVISFQQDPELAEDWVFMKYQTFPKKPIQQDKQEDYIRNLLSLIVETGWSIDPLLPTQLETLKSEKNQLTNMYNTEWYIGVNKEIEFFAPGSFQFKTQGYLESHGLTDSELSEKRFEKYILSNNPFSTDLRSEIIRSTFNSSLYEEMSEEERNKKLQAKLDDESEQPLLTDILDTISNQISEKMVTAKESKSYLISDGDTLNSWIFFYHEIQLSYDDFSVLDVAIDKDRRDILLSRLRSALIDPDLNYYCKIDCSSIERVISPGDKISGRKVFPTSMDHSYYYFDGKIQNGPHLTVKVQRDQKTYQYGDKYIRFSNTGKPHFVSNPYIGLNPTKVSPLETLDHIQPGNFKAAELMRELEGHLFFLEESFQTRIEDYKLIQKYLKELKPSPDDKDFEADKEKITNAEKDVKNFRVNFLKLLEIELQDIHEIIAELQLKKEDWQKDTFLSLDIYEKLGDRWMHLKESLSLEFSDLAFNRPDLFVDFPKGSGSLLELILGSMIESKKIVPNLSPPSREAIPKVQ